MEIEELEDYETSKRTARLNNTVNKSGFLSMTGIFDKPTSVGPATGILSLFFPPKEEDLCFENIEDLELDYEMIQADLIDLDSLPISQIEFKELNPSFGEYSSSISKAEFLASGPFKDTLSHNQSLSNYHQPSKQEITNALKKSKNIKLFMTNEKVQKHNLLLA